MNKFLKGWESASTKHYRNLPLFIGLLVLVIGLTVVVTLVVNTTRGGRSGASGYNCIPLPGCYNNHTCPEIINYKIPNLRWCLPTPTPTPPSGCYYVPVACPLYCIQGQPCPPTCTPKLVCPTPTPTPSGCYYPPYACPNIACVKGQPCPTCTPPKPICPTPKP